MPTETPTTPKTKKATNKAAKWDTTQRLGFWLLLVITVFFWGGVAIGNTAAQQAIADKEAAKVQAIEEYKASQVK